MKNPALLWSVRRELWENRAVYIAPASAALLFLAGFLWSATQLADKMAELEKLDAMRQRALLAIPYEGLAALVILVAGLVGFFYCLDALHGERRDRSILFWKSLPVSDAVAVSAKACIPLIVLPAIVFVVVALTQWIAFGSSLAILAAKGISSEPLVQLPLLRMTAVLLYGVIVLALWHAPLYAYALAISAWAPRSPFLWAVLPPMALAIMERFAIGTSKVAEILQQRFTGSHTEAFTLQPGTALPGALPRGSRVPTPFESMPDPGKFLSSPGLWIGLAVAIALLGLAMWLRRRREPL